MKFIKESASFMNNETFLKYKSDGQRHHLTSTLSRENNFQDNGCRLLEQAFIAGEDDDESLCEDGDFSLGKCGDSKNNTSNFGNNPIMFGNNGGPRKKLDLFKKDSLMEQIMAAEGLSESRKQVMIDSVMQNEFDDEDMLSELKNFLGRDEEA